MELTYLIPLLSLVSATIASHSVSASSPSQNICFSTLATAIPDTFFHASAAYIFSYVPCRLLSTPIAHACGPIAGIASLSTGILHAYPAYPAALDELTILRAGPSGDDHAYPSPKQWEQIYEAGEVWKRMAIYTIATLVSVWGAAWAVGIEGARDLALLSGGLTLGLVTYLQRYATMEV